MYAAIRRYEGVTTETKELTQAARHLASGLSGAHGFVSFLIVEAEEGVLTTVSIFEDQHSLKDADLLVLASLPNHLAALLPESPQIITGEIISQRGL